MTSTVPPKFVAHDIRVAEVVGVGVRCCRCGAIAFHGCDGGAARKQNVHDRGCRDAALDVEVHVRVRGCMAWRAGLSGRGRRKHAIQLRAKRRELRPQIPNERLIAKCVVRLARAYDHAFHLVDEAVDNDAAVGLMLQPGKVNRKLAAQLECVSGLASGRSRLLKQRDGPPPGQFGRGPTGLWQPRKRAEAAQNLSSCVAGHVGLLLIPSPVIPHSSTHLRQHDDQHRHRHSTPRVMLPCAILGRIVFASAVGDTLIAQEAANTCSTMSNRTHCPSRSHNRAYPECCAGN